MHCMTFLPQISDSGSDEPDLLPLDTYTLVIHSPHFFIQPSAVEQGTIDCVECFLNCLHNIVEMVFLVLHRIDILASL